MLDITPIAATTPVRRLPIAALCLLLLLRTALLFGGDGIALAIARASGSARPWPTALLWSNVSVVVVDVITVGVLILLVRRERRGMRELLGAIRPVRDILLGLAVGVGLIVALVVATFIGNLIAWGGAPPAGPTPDAPPVWLGLWSVVILPITVGIAEELFYRGYLLGRLSERWGWWPAALVVSLAFGLQHAAFSATSVQAVLARVIALALVGLALAGLRRLLGGLLPLIIGHVIGDAIGLGLPILVVALGAAG